jgi:hypothetical protein
MQENPVFAAGGCRFGSVGESQDLPGLPMEGRGSGSANAELLLQTCSKLFQFLQGAGSELVICRNGQLRELLQQDDLPRQDTSLETLCSAEFNAL